MKSDGTVWAWGDNGYGQLGDGTTTQRLTPVQVSGLTGVTACGGGGVPQPGPEERRDGLGVGLQRLRPARRRDARRIASRRSRSAGSTGVMAIAAGEHHSLALKSDGTVWAWGRTATVNSATRARRIAAPVQVFITGVVAIAAGAGHSLALKSDGTVWAWGLNANGQLGDGTTMQRTTPVPVSGLTGRVRSPAVPPIAWL